MPALSDWASQDKRYTDASSLLIIIVPRHLCLCIQFQLMQTHSHTNLETRKMEETKIDWKRETQLSICIWTDGMRIWSWLVLYKIYDNRSYAVCARTYHALYNTMYCAKREYMYDCKYIRNWEWSVGDRNRKMIEKKKVLSGKYLFQMKRRRRRCRRWIQPI